MLTVISILYCYKQGSDEFCFVFFISEYFSREILQVVQLDHRVQPVISKYSQKALLRGVPSFSRVLEP